jgi:hypothetical protein
MRWRPRKRGKDLEREVRSHLETEADELRESGLAAAEAHPDAKTAANDVAALSITPDYFRVMGVPLDKGRF